MPRYITARRFPAGLAAVAMLAVAGACASRPGLEAVDRVSPPGAAVEPFEGGMVAQWPAEPTRLADDIERAIQDLHWGRLSLRREPGADEAATVVRAAALLPDDRTARIIAWGVDERTVRVAVRVGHFGDAGQQRAFINAVAKRLHGKARPQRGGTFALPE